MTEQAIAQPQVRARGTYLFGRYYVSDRTRRVVRQLFTRPTSLAGLLLLLFFIAVAVAAPLIAPLPDVSDPSGVCLWNTEQCRIPHEGYSPDPKAPSPAHLFGTTSGQYDIFYGIVWGTRTAFMVGIVVTGSALLIGLTLGSVSGYYGGWIDDLLMRIVEIVLAFPFLLAAITLAAVLLGQIGRGIIVGMIALAAFAWPTYARLIRAEILTVKQRDYVIAARAVGASDLRIMVQHILPNAIFPTLVYASLDIGSYVISFAALSFLGLGAEPGYADWGQMISYARNWIPSLATYPHIVLYPGLAILLFVMAWNLIGDAFRDIIDPRLSGSR